LWFGILGILAAIVGYFSIDTKKIRPLASSKTEDDYFSIPESLKIISSNGQFLWIGLFSMATLGPVSCFCDAWGVSFLECVYGMGKMQAASIVSLIYLGTIFGAPLAAFLSKKFESYKKIMVLGGVLLFVLFAMIIFVKVDVFVLKILIFSAGVAFSGQFLSFPAVLSMAPSKISATLTGTVNSITMLGSTLLIPLIGGIMDFSKNSLGYMQTYSPLDYKSGMAMILISIAFSILALCFVKDEYHQNSSNN
jgi:sugar phosphate permease